MFVVKHKPSNQYLGWSPGGYFMSRDIDSAKIFPTRPFPRQDGGILHRRNWIMECREQMSQKREDYEVAQLIIRECKIRPLFQDWVEQEVAKAQASKAQERTVTL